MDQGVLRFLVVFLRQQYSASAARYRSRQFGSYAIYPPDVTGDVQVARGSEGGIRRQFAQRNQAGHINTESYRATFEMHWPFNVPASGSSLERSIERHLGLLLHFLVRRCKVTDLAGIDGFNLQT